MKLQVEQRATALFVDAARDIRAACNAMVKQQAAKGMAASGNTATMALEIFDKRSREALRTITTEVANRIDDRGRAWQKAMGEVEQALDAYIAAAPDLLAASFEVAQITTHGPPGHRRQTR